MRRSLGLAAMGMRRRLDHGRDEADLPMGHAALGDDGLRKRPHRGGIAAQDGQLEATVVIQVNVQGRDLQLMMRMMGIRKALGQLARMVVRRPDRARSRV